MSAEQKYRLLIVDDHPLLLDGLRTYLGRHEDVEVVGEARSGQEALRQVLKLKPDIALLDIALEDTSGLEVARHLRTQMPACDIIFFTVHDDAALVRQAAEIGVRGYVLKNAPPEELHRAICAVGQGEVFFSQGAAGVLLRDISTGGRAGEEAGLTERERQVLVRIARGLTSKEIAAHLQVSTRTVETYRERLMGKLDIHTIAGLTHYAIAQGLVEVQG